MDKNQILTDWASNHKANGISAAQMIAEYYPAQIGMLIDPDMWPQIIDQTASAFHVDIVTPKQDDWRLNVLERYSANISHYIQFPANTCFLHGLGVLSAAMNRKFSFEQRIGSDTEKPVNLFCVSAQPPSTGKSFVNDSFFDPILIAFKGVSDANKQRRSKINDDIQELKKMLKTAYGAQMDGINRDLISKAEELENYCDFIPFFKDPTPEGMLKAMAKQGGCGNVISDEADAVNVLLGSVYGDAGKPANSGLILAMFNGEWMSVARAGSDGFFGRVRGTVAVLAQEATVRAILEAGKLGRGVGERFLLINEPDFLGHRDHMTKRYIDKGLKAEYIDLINNLIHESEIKLTFDEDSHHALDCYRQNIEPHLIAGGKYGDNMIRGTLGKCTDQIQRIACILWGAQEWSKNGKRRKVIGYKTTCRAIEIFDELSRTYLKAAEDSGCAGLTPKLDIVIKQLKNRFQKDVKDRKTPKITVQQLQQNLKSKKEFASTGGLTSYLREVILPALVAANVVMLCRGEWLINPNVLDGE